MPEGILWYSLPSDRRQEPHFELTPGRGSLHLREWCTMAVHVQAISMPVWALPPWLPFEFRVGRGGHGIGLRFRNACAAAREGHGPSYWALPRG